MSGGLPHADYPWRLRLEHEGHASIRVERRGRWLRFDPHLPPDPDDVSVVTWVELERAKGVVTAIREGRRPTVLATPDVRAWLHEKGEVDDHSLGGTIDGVRVEALEYTPIPYATPPEAARKVRAALRHPAMAVGRLRQRVGLPRTKPIVTQLTLPDGGRLLHLNCSLHQGTDVEWLRRAQDRFRGADWMIVGADYEHEAALLEMVPGFEAGVVLVADLVNETRREIGMPVNILTPTVDALVERGIEAHPFVREAGFRFE
ncbi:MAG: hypothetical protein H6741_15115 [Alphaproteobacteria bacterium]|nr:hypothetical protein [Alphaproteobacteria bacterium]